MFKDVCVKMKLFDVKSSSTIVKILSDNDYQTTC